MITASTPNKELGREYETGISLVNIRIFFSFLAQPYLSFEMTN